MTTKEMIEVMQAFEDGKIIQTFACGTWVDVEGPAWNWSNCDYRIKPKLEKKYRPYKDTDEMIEDWKARFKPKDWPSYSMPLIWVKEITSCSGVVMVTAFSNREVVTATITRSMEELFARCKYLDGSPCGKEMTEC